MIRFHVRVWHVSPSALAITSCISSPPVIPDCTAKRAKSWRLVAGAAAVAVIRPVAVELRRADDNAVEGAVAVANERTLLKTRSWRVFRFTTPARFGTLDLLNRCRIPASVPVLV